MAETEPTLEARDVHKIYPGGIEALRGVCLEVRAGETVALVGESGSGKSTLLRLFNRMVAPTSGEVRVEGRPAGAWDPIVLRRRTGYVAQEGGLIPHWTVLQNVALVPWLLNEPAEARKARARELLQLVGLEPERYESRYPKELSGGERQRVAFARALAADPPVVLLDEPFGALDALTRLRLQRQFLELKLRLRKTMLLVTHDLREAFLLADRIAVMKDGRILQCAPPDAIRARPEPVYVARLLELLTAKSP